VPWATVFEDALENFLFSARFLVLLAVFGAITVSGGEPSAVLSDGSVWATDGQCGANAARSAPLLLPSTRVLPSLAAQGRAPRTLTASSAPSRHNPTRCLLSRTTEHAYRARRSRRPAQPLLDCTVSSQAPSGHSHFDPCPSGTTQTVTPCPSPHCRPTVMFLKGLKTVQKALMALKAGAVP